MFAPKYSMSGNARALWSSGRPRAWVLPTFAQRARKAGTDPGNQQGVNGDQTPPQGGRGEGQARLSPIGRAGSGTETFA
jgi:hypothetical protein